MDKIKQKTAKLVKIENNTEIDKNLNILEILTKYIKLYTETQINKNLSNKTINNATLILERFFTYTSDELAENECLTIFDINKYFLSNYLNKLTLENLSKNTQKLHLTVIKGFFWFIADYDIKQYGFLKLNINGLKIKTDQKEKESFSQNDQNLILRHLTKLDTVNSFLAQRNSLLLKTLLYTGLRISELINIKWTDIVEYEDQAHGLIYTILVKGKGNKERYAYLAYDQVANNIEFLQQQSNKLDRYVFTTTHGNQCNRSMLFLVVKNALEKAGLTKYGLHVFRHTFARELVNKNINLATIKDLLGHSNISITAQFYAKTNERAKRNALFRK